MTTRFKNSAALPFWVAAAAVLGTLASGAPSAAANVSESPHSTADASAQNVRKVISKHSGKCLTVRGASKANNATVNQYRCVSGAKNQQWRMEMSGGD
ncbi:RICIN domain-containing protein, partial [Streptomyces iconiensis]